MMHGNMNVKFISIVVKSTVIIVTIWNIYTHTHICVCQSD